MNVKSNTCIGVKTKKPLTAYYSQSSAQEAANFVKQNYNNSMLPYRCDKCDLWHIAPQDRHTPSEKCNRCTSANGASKDLYKNKNDAIKRAAILKNERGIKLTVYKCPRNFGWHLTKCN
jgi:hypothetical protein